MNSKEEYLAAVEQAEANASVEDASATEIRADDWRKDLIKSKDGKIESRQHNFSLIMANDENLKGRFRLDTFGHRITLQGELPFGLHEQPTDLDDIIFTKLLSYLGATYHIENNMMAQRALREAASDCSYDSLVERLDGLMWDGTPRIETMFSTLLGAEDCGYTREVAKLLMRGAVCRAYSTEGVQFDLMVVLYGKQGCRKTSFCRCLAMQPEYFEDNLGELGKPDAARKMQGTLIVEMAELASIKSTRQEEAVKAFITRIYDSYRLLYVEDTVKYPRRCVLIGTTNNPVFLNDSLWERRYLPIECGEHETTFDWTNEESRRYFFEQIWAEAVVWYKSDPKGIMKTLTPTSEILKEIKKVQSRFRVEDPWYAPIEQYLSENQSREICAKELIVKALETESYDNKPDQGNYRKIHELMRGRFPKWKRIDEPKRLGEWGLQNIYYVYRDE